MNQLTKESCYQIGIRARNKRKRIRYTITEFNPKTQARVRAILSGLLSSDFTNELRDSLHSCIMEILHNAIKANFKSIYFENQSPHETLSGKIDISTAISLFRLELSRSETTLGRIAKKKGISSHLSFEFSKNSFTASVHNPIQMTADEQNNVYRKLEDAKKCDSLTDYIYQSQSDPSREGAGIGIVMTSLIIQGLVGHAKGNPHLFR